MNKTPVTTNLHEGDPLFIPGTNVRFGDYHIVNGRPVPLTKSGKNVGLLTPDAYFEAVWGSKPAIIILEDGRRVA